MSSLFSPKYFLSSSVFMKHALPLSRCGTKSIVSVSPSNTLTYLNPAQQYMFGLFADDEFGFSANSLIVVLAIDPLFGVCCVKKISPPDQ